MDRTFQLTKSGTISSGLVAPAVVPFTIPISTADYSESDGTYGFEMTVVYWGTDTDWSGVSKWAFGCAVKTATPPVVFLSGASEIYKIYNVVGNSLSSVAAVVVGLDIRVDLTFDTSGSSPTRYWRAFIDAFFKDNV